MINKNNAAIVILAARIPLLIDVLDKLYENWNKAYKYPIYIHTFGDLINKNMQSKIKNRYKNEVIFCEINPEFPKHINENELYYNRKYLDYVSKAFPKKRSGYLHMCYFKTNITNFGFKGCLDIRLRNFEKLMFYDDDAELKKKIDFDFFDLSNNYPIVTGYTTKRKADREHKDVTENLWLFYKQFIKKNNIKPLNKILHKAIINDDEEAIYNLEYTCGALEVYNLKLIANNFWSKYIGDVNNFGGNYKHRWGDMQVVNLFTRTFFENPILNLDLVNKGFLNQKIKGSEHFIYFNKSDIYSSRFYNFILKLKKIIWP